MHKKSSQSNRSQLLTLTIKLISGDMKLTPEQIDALTPKPVVIEIQHVRKFWAIKDHRIGAQFRTRATAETLCGAPITAFDVSRSDALANKSWPKLCPVCLRGLELGSFLNSRHPYRKTQADVFPS